MPTHAWRDIIGMRHVLAHGYFGVDSDIVWSVATTRISSLKSDVTAYLQDAGRTATDGEGPDAEPAGGE